MKKQIINELLKCVQDATDTETKIIGLLMCATLFESVLDEAINDTHCCTEFFCEDNDLKYSSKKCKEQCSGCKWIENL